jgi:DNA-directed RNA polymerase subunit H (RpoH/RPB5)
MSTHNKIVNIYKSRQNILNILDSIYGYDITDYSGFSYNEVDAMYNNDQLDMLLTHKKSGDKTIPMSKTYIKYNLQGSLNSSSLNVIIEDLYALSDTLSKEDCLFIVYDGEPNDSLVKYLNQIYANDNIFVVVYNIKRLQFNILEHALVPKVSIMSEKEVEALKTKYSIDNMKKLPEISRFDPQAQAICLRPGQVCCFIRNSVTSMETPYYRVCV